MTKQQTQDQQQAVEQLRTILQPGDTVYTILRHVSRSGMQRVIDCYAKDQRWIGGLVARAIGSRFDERKQGIVIGGCGMDMGFAIVYDLSFVLNPKGFQCVGERCPANDHSNGDRTTTPHQHNDGGYALRHSWL